jgi:hypothetical protein
MEIKYATNILERTIILECNSTYYEINEFDINSNITFNLYNS